MTTRKSTIYETPGGYELRVDNCGNVSLREPTPIIPGQAYRSTAALDLSPEDINELAAMFDEAARDLRPELRVAS